MRETSARVFCSQESASSRALRAAPLGLIPIAQAIASGSEKELYIAIRQYIDAPL